MADFRVIRSIRIVIAICVWGGALGILFLKPAWAAYLFALLIAGIVVACIGGRWYCSLACPFGLLQDGIGGIARLATGKRFRYRNWRVSPTLRWGLLAALLLMALLGIILPFAGADPYSNFSRITAALLRPGVAAATVEITPRPMGYGAVWWSALVLGALTLAVLWRGRIFCQVLCPVGGILGFLSRRARMQMRLDAKKCVKCGQCVHRCPSGCIDPKTGELDFSRCTLCFNCGSVCKFGAIAYQGGAVKTPPLPNAARRRFLLGAGITVAAAAAGAAALREQRTRLLAGREKTGTLPVMPPGAMSLERFTSRCTACHLCVANCTGKVLRPAGLTEYGLAGAGQPHLDFRAGMCEFRCHNCSSVCPTGALKKLPLPEKQRLQIGIAHYRRDNCVVYLDKDRDCGACAEHCPTGALTMQPDGDGYRLPKIVEALCIGCGSCVKACPQHPDCPLTVSGLALQTQAVSPEQYFKTHADDAPAVSDDWAF